MFRQCKPTKVLLAAAVVLLLADGPPSTPLGGYLTTASAQQPDSGEQPQVAENATPSEDGPQAEPSEGPDASTRSGPASADESNQDESDSSDSEKEEAAQDESGAQETFSFFQRLNLQNFWEENGMTQWSVLLGAIFIGFIAGRIAAWSLRHLGKRWEGCGWQARALLFTGLASPASLACLTVGLTIGLAALRMSPPMRGFSTKLLLLLYTISVFWYLFNLVEVIDVVLRRMTAKTATKLDEQIVPLVRKTLRVFLVIFGVMFVSETIFNQNIGAWLAGLGIAGLAISLAAQDSLKNLFGSVTILLDRPFQVGERIVYAGHDGIIEEIGFRSTKMRTLTGHLVTIPNSNIVNDPVENIGRRPTIRRLMNVTITYDTPREKIDEAVGILRSILEEDGIREPIHPTIGADEFPPRVYFSDFNSDSLGILVIYWYAPPNYWDYMEHAQRVNLRIFEEFEKAGIEFAFPTQTLFLAGDPKRELAVKMLGRDLDGTSPPEGS